MKRIVMTKMAACIAVCGLLGWAAFGALQVAVSQWEMSRSGEARSDRMAFSAQQRRDDDRPRPRIRVQPPAAWDYPRPDTYSPPGPGYVRLCQAWYATEYRPSGTVVTPQQRCRWVRG